MQPHPTLMDVDIHTLIARHDALFFDAYGVLVRSDGAIPGAIQLTQHLHAIAHPFFILTNDASRSIATAAQRYRDLGLTVRDEQVITSGSLLADTLRRDDLLAHPVMVLGTHDARQSVQDAGAQLVLPDPHAHLDALVIADLSEDPLRDMEAALSALLNAIDRGHIPKLYLPNPDLIYPATRASYGITAGSIARMFEVILDERYPQENLRFERFGKPFPPIYLEALRRTNLPPERAVMIGDQLATDVRGALQLHIPAALVSTGIATRAQLGTHRDCLPNYLLSNLWPQATP